MASAEADLLEAIVEAPDDDGPRLVAADWYDEHGHSDRATFIRTQIELARDWPEPPKDVKHTGTEKRPLAALTGKYGSYKHHCRCRYCSLKRTEYNSSKRYIVWEWHKPAIPDPDGPANGGIAQSRGIYFDHDSWRRGFPFAMTMKSDDFMGRKCDICQFWFVEHATPPGRPCPRCLGTQRISIAEEIGNRYPITAVAFTDLNPVVLYLADDGSLQAVRRDADRIAYCWRGMDSVGPSILNGPNGVVPHGLFSVLRQFGFGLQAELPTFFDGGRPIDVFIYPSPHDALVALSRAAVAYMRGLAGRSPYAQHATPGDHPTVDDFRPYGQGHVLGVSGSQNWFRWVDRLRNNEPPITSRDDPRWVPQLDGRRFDSEMEWERNFVGGLGRTVGEHYYGIQNRRLHARGGMVQFDDFHSAAPDVPIDLSESIMRYAPGSIQTGLVEYPMQSIPANRDAVIPTPPDDQVDALAYAFRSLGAGPVFPNTVTPVYYGTGPDLTPGPDENNIVVPGGSMRDRASEVDDECEGADGDCSCPDCLAAQAEIDAASPAE